MARAVITGGVTQGRVSFGKEAELWTPTGFANLNKLVNWTLHFALWVIERIILYYFPYNLLLVSYIRSSVKLLIVEPANQT